MGPASPVQRDRGTGTITENGYLRWRLNGRDVFEHQLVAERKLGRRLRPDEDVHHINGDKLDNRPENIAVLKHSEHSRLHGSDHECRPLPRRNGYCEQCSICGKFVARQPVQPEPEAVKA